jgi:predicted house-cleaning noncanonical NTP pyrophosphatase (MazG superfamily)
MSQFGHGSFKQNLLEHLLETAEDRQIDLLYTIEQVMEVVSHLASIAYKKDNAVKEIYEQAKEDAKRELLAKINK